MRENLDRNKLVDLAQIGSKDNNIIQPQSASAVISVITAVVDVSLAASLLFSCADNPAQCD